jgi:hypothetical protein
MSPEEPVKEAGKVAPEAVAPAAPAAAPSPAPSPAPIAAAKPVAAARPRGASSGALAPLLLAALLVALGAAAAWYERQLEAQAVALADEIALSVVPDAALVPSNVKGARTANAVLAASLGGRFASRAEPVSALRVIEAAAKVSGAPSSFSRVEVLGWSGEAADFGDGFARDLADESPYGAVAVSLEAAGTWAETLSLAADLEALPLVARVDALRLAAATDESGAAAWSLSAQMAVAAK